MPKQKYYVVWKGRKTGIFTSWAECEAQVKGYVDAEFKAFGTLKEAETAYKSSYKAYKGRSSSLGKWKNASVKPIFSSICVDAASSGSSGRMEYRGGLLESREEVFRIGPFTDGTNNVGEFLAIVHALTWLDDNKKYMTVYSDSQTAISWVKTGTCKTMLKHTSGNAPIFKLIKNAEDWLAENEIRENAVFKWKTDLWGEIPADFGRK
jgi:ribonuclease HI